MNTIHFKLVTPEKTVLSQEIISLTCPTIMGQITILPGHVPLVSALKSGELHAKNSQGEESFLFVSGGFVEIRPGSEVVVLADAAEHHFEIDQTVTEEAAARAQKAMSEEHLSAEEYATVAANLERNLTKLNIARRHSHTKHPLSSEGIFKE
jgi:F-type H+-transporting ATPase subunit epsilon